VKIIFLLYAEIVVERHVSIGDFPNLLQILFDMPKTKKKINGTRKQIKNKDKIILQNKQPHFFHTFFPRPHTSTPSNPHTSTPQSKYTLQ